MHISLKEKILSIFIGSALLSFGINFFFLPLHIFDGGILGISLLLNYLSGFNVGYSMVMINIIIFVCVWLMYPSAFYSSLMGMFVSSFFIDLLNPSSILIEYLFLPPGVLVMLGGAIVGAGIGIMLRYRTSTDGLDLIAHILSRKLSINVGILILFIDIAIILLGGFMISSQAVFYSILALSVSGITIMICTATNMEMKNR